MLRLSGKKTINYTISPWKTKTNDDYWYTQKKFCRGGGCLLGEWGVSAARGCLLQGVCVCVCVETPPVTATAAGGTHPTGMHSCLEMF